MSERIIKKIRHAIKNHLLQLQPISANTYKFVHAAMHIIIK